MAPIEASSGKVTRRRLNRGGDRQANHALWRIALCRMRHDARTRAYVERRTAEGLSKLEIIRILKRHIAQEVYRQLPAADPVLEQRAWPANRLTPLWLSFFRSAGPLLEQHESS